MKETIKNIDNIVAWWLNLQKGFTDMNSLDEVHRKLSGYYYYLSEIVSDSYRDYLFSYVHKKIGLGKREQALTESGMTATLAKSTAPLHERDLMIDEAESESTYNALKLKLNATSKVLEAIRQRISNLKSEKNTTPHT